jgi:hypothetical protein
MYNQVSKLFHDIKLLIEQELMKIYSRDEIKDVAENPKLQSRVIMKGESRFVNISEVPYEYLSRDD